MKKRLLFCLFFWGCDYAPEIPSPNKSMVLISHWYPEAEQGGFYQALIEGIYAQDHIPITIRPGTPSISSLQLMLKGRGHMALTHASEVIFALQNNFPVVAVSAFFQKSPQTLFAHVDVNSLVKKNIFSPDSTLYARMFDYHTWVPFLQHNFYLKGMQFHIHKRNPLPFIRNPKAIYSGYLLSDATLLHRILGSELKMKLVCDYGYCPYESILMVRKDVWELHGDRIKKFVLASQKGWQHYLQNPKTTHKYIMDINPEMNTEKLNNDFQYILKNNFVKTPEQLEKNIGQMDEKRWQNFYQNGVKTGIFKPNLDLNKILKWNLWKE